MWVHGTVEDVPYAAMSSAPSVVEDPATATPRGGPRPWWALPVVVLAIAAVAIATYVGVRGLFGDPIRSVAADGTATIEGTFEPYDCTGCPVQGYVQAGGRSVFVILRGGCPVPARGSSIAVHARLDASQGKQTYRSVDCPVPA
jgi:hypothetical protein